MFDDTPSPMLHVLLVEDNDDDVEAVRRLFARAEVPARLWVARDGEEARDMLFTRRRPGARSLLAPPRIGLVLLDLALPRVDGLGLLRCMKADARLRAVPVVVLTGSGARDRIWEFLQMGCNMYLLKPMDIADLANIVSGVQKYWLPEGAASLAA